MKKLPSTELQNEMFAQYTQGASILIADAAAASQVRLLNHLLDLNLKPEQVWSASTFQEALGLIETKKPKIILSEYLIGKNSGLDLLLAQRKHHENFPHSVMILITENSSQSAVALAAEGDIDGYILKPFTPETLRQGILNAALQRLRPNDYVIQIEKAKQALASKQAEQAVDLLNRALEMHPRPALAYSYLGQALQVQGENEAALMSYKKGLELNKIHFKCLIGLHDLYVKLGNPVEAFKVTKRITQYFPSNTHRLAQSFREAIEVKSYEDMEYFYRFIPSIENPGEELILYACSGLIILAKHYLLTDRPQRAMENLGHALRLADKRARFFTHAAELLLEFNQVGEVESMLRLFPETPEGQVQLKIVQHLLKSREMGAKEVLLSTRDLIKQGIDHPSVSMLLIKTLHTLGQIDAALAEMNRGVKLWPKEKSRFEETMKELKIS